jgi:DNA topoisomerase-1
VRSHIASEYGSNYSPASPRQYVSKVKNAQEAHEAIRPALPLRSPERVAGELKQQELALYRLIWQRTLASQMADATGITVSVRLGATANDENSTDVEFSASGTTITFAGYRQAYEESTDEDADTDGAEDALMLPPLTVGQGINISDYVALSHTTTPPPRYTEASIVKKLEELSIGRPSTWASIISSMVDRGFYLWKKGNSLVPTWLAFSVVRLMKEHFSELIDFEFTAKVEEDLDAIARGEKHKVEWLNHFYFGDDADDDIPGLKQIVSNNLDTIDAAEINTVVLGKHPDTGDVIIVKPGQYGPFVRCAENTAGVPDSMAPDELTVEAAMTLLNAPKGDVPIGEIDGHPVFVKSGRYGPYVQWGTMDEPPTGLEKPKTASLFKTMNIERISMKDATDLLSLPRTLGTDPSDGVPITAQNGPYGPYISKGKESRSLQTEEQLLEVTLEHALELLAQPRVYGRGRSAPKPPLREFGNDPASGQPVVAKEGRFGDYVTDGETNAGLTRGDRLEEMTNERAYELLQLRRDYIAEHGTKKKSARKKAPAKKAAAKKTPAKKKAAAKKASAKKSAAKKAAPGAEPTKTEQ